MKPNIEFSCKVVVGLGGVTVLDLKEAVLPEFKEGKTDPCAVKEDILSDSAEAWLQWSGIELKMPKDEGLLKEGVYFVRGEVRQSEDDISYESSYVRPEFSLNALPPEISEEALATLAERDPFIKSLRPSESVLVRVKGFKEPMIGLYYHSTDCWSISGLDGNNWEVIIWWPMPTSNGNMIGNN
ncbi:hypothetical protein [Neptuniibacter sp. QD37_11]|uniref:hypothetical protein n=1 Tax=Neptuniibacter sp. QD37_11 TaxID=3398209 RepID=UPI0039F52D17